jgi:hypothetical protein
MSRLAPLLGCCTQGLPLQVGPRQPNSVALAPRLQRGLRGLRTTTSRSGSGRTVEHSGNARTQCAYRNHFYEQRHPSE